MQKHNDHHVFHHDEGISQVLSLNKEVAVVTIHICLYILLWTLPDFHIFDDIAVVLMIYADANDHKQTLVSLPCNVT